MSIEFKHRVASYFSCRFLFRARDVRQRIFVDWYHWYFEQNILLRI
jgi:hypothetical protein